MLAAESKTVAVALTGAVYSAAWRRGPACTSLCHPQPSASSAPPVAGLFKNTLGLRAPKPWHTSVTHSPGGGGRSQPVPGRPHARDSPSRPDAAWQHFLKQLRRLRQQARHELHARHHEPSAHAEADVDTLAAPRAPRDGASTASAMPGDAGEVLDKRLMDSLGVSDLLSLQATSASATVHERLEAAVTTARKDASERVGVVVTSEEAALAALVEAACRAGLRTHASAVLVVHHVLDALLDGAVSSTEPLTARASPGVVKADRDRSSCLEEKWSALSTELPNVARLRLFTEDVCTALLAHQAQWMARRVGVWQSAVNAAAVVSTPSSTARRTVTDYLQKEHAKRVRTRWPTTTAWIEDGEADVSFSVAQSAAETVDLIHLLARFAPVLTPTAAHIALTQATLRCCRYARHPSLAHRLIDSFMRARADDIDSESTEPHTPVDPQDVLATVALAVRAMPGHFALNYGLWLRYRAMAVVSADGRDEGPEDEDHLVAERADAAAPSEHATAFLTLLPDLAASVEQSAAQLEALQRPFETLLTDTDTGYLSTEVERVRTGLVSLLHALSRVSLESAARVEALNRLFRLAQVNALAGVTEHAEVVAACACVFAAAQQPSPSLTLFNKLLVESTRASVAFQESLMGAIVLCGRSAVDEDVPRLLSFQALKYPLTEDTRDALAVKLLLQKHALHARRVALRAAQRALALEEAAAAEAVGPEDPEDGVADEKKERRQVRRKWLDSSLSRCGAQMTSATTSLFLLLSREANAADDQHLPVGHPSTLSQTVVHRERQLFLFLLTFYQDLLLRVDDACDGVRKGANHIHTPWSVTETEQVRQHLQPVMAAIDADCAASLDGALKRFAQTAASMQSSSPSSATTLLLHSLVVALHTHVAQLTDCEWPMTIAVAEAALTSWTCAMSVATESSAALDQVPSPCPLLLARGPLVFADLVASWPRHALRHFVSTIGEALKDGRGPYQLRHRDAATLRRLQSYLAMGGDQTTVPSHEGRVMALSQEVRLMCEAATSTDRPRSAAADGTSSAAVPLVFLEEVLPQAFPTPEAPALPTPVPALRHALSSTSSTTQSLFLPGTPPAAAMRGDAREALHACLASLLTFWLDTWRVEQIATRASTTLPYAFQDTESEPLDASAVFSNAATATVGVAGFFDAHTTQLLAMQDAHVRRAQDISEPMAPSMSAAHNRGEGDADTDNADDMPAQNDWTLSQDDHAETPAVGTAEQPEAAHRRKTHTGARRQVKQRATYVPVERFVNIYA